MVQKWFLPSISELLAQQEYLGLSDEVMPQGQASITQKGDEDTASRREREQTVAQYEIAVAKAQRQWTSAIATVEQLLLQTVNRSAGVEPSETCSGDQGLILSGPVPILSHCDLLSRFQIGIFRASALNTLAWMPFQLPPATTEPLQQPTNTPHQLSLLPGDPLATEQFCLIVTHRFSLVMACGEDLSGVPGFRFSFAPDDIEQAWVTLRPRLLLTNPHQFGQLEALIQKLSPKAPDYQLVMHFGRQLLKNLPEPQITHKNQTLPLTAEQSAAQASSPQPSQSSTVAAERHWERLVKPEERSVSRLSISTPREATPDIELLQALTHEIRTPLTTIRTLTKLLLKRQDLAPEVMRRLEIIDHECTEQINRMELIFRAVELETAAAKQVPVNLTSMSLAQVFQQSIPRWQKQAARRNISLDIVLPQDLPTVVSNPNLLDQMLTGLIENFTRSLPAGGHIQVHVTPAGDQLKLQFQSQSHSTETSNTSTKTDSPCPTVKSIGQLLMFQPETGSLSLNLNVTKHLFQALGGKLIVRQRPQEGEVMTIFLPLQVNDTAPIRGQKEIFC